MKYSCLTYGRLLTLIGGVLILSSCQHVNVAQITYELLRADDCRRNQLEDFCARTYASDYYDYVKLRRDFLRHQQQAEQRRQSDELPLQQALNIF